MALDTVVYSSSLVRNGIVLSTELFFRTDTECVQGSKLEVQQVSFWDTSFSVGLFEVGIGAVQLKIRAAVVCA